MRYRADIDGLRAIAVLLVLTFHFHPSGVGKAGFIGVDVFFVISGFLITSIVTRQLDGGSFHLGGFYLNRIRRLFPALFATLALATAFGWFRLFPRDFEDLLSQVLASQFYVANFFYWQNINYFALQSENVLLLHTWSLAVEEQFYLFYPVALLLVHRYLRRYLLVALILGLTLSFALNLLFVADKPEATFYFLPTRAWELLAGALICFLDPRRLSSRWLLELVGALGFVLIVLGVTRFDQSVRFPGHFALLPTMGAVCLIVAGSGAPTAATRVLGLRALVYVGKISYPLYLVHWPINVFARMELGDGYGPPWRALAFCLSIAIAALLYHGVENPVRLRRVLAGNGRLSAGYAGALAATVATFALVHGNAGLSGRFPPEVARLAGHVDDRATGALRCEYRGEPLRDQSSFCRIGNGQEEPRWLIHGDSHAWAGHGAFDRWLRHNHEAGLFKFLNSCPPVQGVHLFRGRGLCSAYNDAVVEFLEADPSIQNVLLVSTWRQAIEARLSPSSDVRLSPEASVELFERQFAETVDRLNSLGRRVYIWEPVPGARRSVPMALARAAWTREPADLEIDGRDYRATFGFFFSVLERNAPRITHRFSPSAALCGTGRCAVTTDGRPLYFDNAHMADSSADFWAQLLIDQQPSGAAER